MKISESNAYILNKPDTKVLLRNTGDFILTCPRMWYNCGGFALGLDEWYLPYDYDSQGYDDIYYIREEIDNGYDYYDGCTEIARIMVDYMCETLDNVREVVGESELREDEYLVAFKASFDDFHYARRMDNGEWYHKMGSSCIECVTEDEVYGDDWWTELSCNYSGELFMLAVKKPNHTEKRLKRKASGKCKVKVKAKERN